MVSYGGTRPRSTELRMGFVFPGLSREQRSLLQAQCNSYCCGEKMVMPEQVRHDSCRKWLAMAEDTRHDSRREQSATASRRDAVSASWAWERQLCRLVSLPNHRLRPARLQLKVFRATRGKLPAQPSSCCPPDRGRTRGHPHFSKDSKVMPHTHAHLI